MKDKLKLVIIGLCGLFGAAIPLSTAYFVWSACMAAVPVAWASAALIKVLLSIILFLVGFGLTVWLTIVLGGLGVLLATALLDP